ncbi:MAG TPA: hypothetical protein VJ867_13970 [Gemmatimonadaceae bacterium]|nr:hypothetical protein [Gemmatimonadaceae bacterium]
MKKPITPFTHGVMDYATVATVAAAPKLMELPDEAADACYVLAAGYAGLSMFTDYPLAVKRAIPFKVHGIAEAAIGALLPMLPFVLGFGRNARARNLFFGLTALTAMTAAMTDWNKQSERAARRRHKRRPRLVRAA